MSTVGMVLNKTCKNNCTVSTRTKAVKKRGPGFGCVDFCILKTKSGRKKRGPDVGAPAHKITVLEYVIFSMFQNSQTTKSMFSSFEILACRIQYTPSILNNYWCVVLYFQVSKSQDFET